jgi:hypothetical protein
MTAAVGLPTPSKSVPAGVLATFPPVFSNIPKALPVMTNGPSLVTALPVQTPAPVKISMPTGTPPDTNAGSVSVPAPVKSSAVDTQSVAAVATNATAGVKPSGYVRREHLNFRSEEAAQLFLRQMARKEAVADQIRVVARLIEEKNVEFAQYAQALQSQFSVNSAVNYNYDAQAMTIYVLETQVTGTASARSGKESAAETVVQKEHMKLKDKKSEQQFLQLVAARRLTTEELRSLQFILREKNMELELREQELSANYSISKDRAYQYNQQNLTLYELVPTPKGQGVADDVGTVPVK